MLKCILQGFRGCCRLGPVVGCDEHSTESSGSIQGNECFVLMGDYQLLKVSCPHYSDSKVERDQCV